MLRTSKAPHITSNDQGEESNLKRTSYTLKVTFVVTCYFIVSISLVFSNKVVMSSEGTSIPAPLFITWYQCILTAAFVWILGFIGKGKSKENFFAQFPNQRYDIKVAREILPLSLVFVGMVTFNNLCLQLVEVSFYNVARSLTICFNVIFTFMILGEKTSKRTIATLFIVIAGFFVGSEGEINFSFVGTVFGVLSSIFVSLNSIYTKKVLPKVDKDEWKLAFYNNVNAVLLFIPLMIIFGEVQILIEYSALLKSKLFWSVMTLAGVLGFAIGIITIVQINLTSPLTHNMVGTAKSGLQTLLALMIWQNPTTFHGLIGVVLVLLGSGVYTIVRATEPKIISSSLPITTSPTSIPISVELHGPSPDLVRSDLRSSLSISPSEFPDLENCNEGNNNNRSGNGGGGNGLLKEDSGEEDGLGDNGFVRISIERGNETTTTTTMINKEEDIELNTLKKQKD